MDGKVIPSSNKSNIFAKKSNTSRKPRPKMTLEFTDGEVTGTKRVPSDTLQNKKAKQSLSSVKRSKTGGRRIRPSTALPKGTGVLKTLGKVASKANMPAAVLSTGAMMVDYGKRVVEEPKLTEKDRKAKRERFGSIRKKAKEGRNDKVLSFEEQTDPKIPQRPKVRKDDSAYNAVRRNQGYVKRGDVFEPNSGGFPNILGRGVNTVAGFFSDKTKKAIDTTKKEDAQYKKEMTTLKKYNIPKKAKEGRNDVDLLRTR